MNVKTYINLLNNESSYLEVWVKIPYHAKQIQPNWHFMCGQNTKRDFNQICQEIWPEATLAIKLVTDLPGSEGVPCSERPLSGVVPLTLWSWKSYVKHFVNWSGWVKVVSSTSQPLGVRWHGITSHFIQIGQSLVFFLGFRWGCMDPYYLEFLEAGARDILSKPCVPILYDPITRQFEAWLDAPEAEVWNSEAKVESFRLSSLLRGWTCSMWSQSKVFLLHVHTQTKGSQVPLPTALHQPLPGSQALALVAVPKHQDLNFRDPLFCGGNGTALRCGPTNNFHRFTHNIM